ncbi:MAG: F-type H+-transporting ATPase subunit b [Mariniblastus sp.]|jgi:F-type H+-transporting ATPase subunit b
MPIDWFTVVAQAINFLILVWLMRRFLYKPILDAIDAREIRIAAELADADAKQDAAQKQRAEFQHKNEAFDQQRAALMSQAADEAKIEGLRLVGEARAAANDLRAKQQETLRREQQSLTSEIKRRTREEVFAIARKTLTDLAGVDLEEQMSAVFTRRVRELNGEAKDSFANALKSSSEPPVVRSTFDLPAEQHAAIQLAVNETFAANIKLRFDTAPTVISGIELTANGHKVGWSIAEYLMSLERSVDHVLQAQSRPQVTPADKTESKNE